jgi:hypothetical protein
MLSANTRYLHTRFGQEYLYSLLVPILEVPREVHVICYRSIHVVRERLVAPSSHQTTVL